jgi:hypothetical protein
VGSTATESRYLQSEDPEWPVSLRAVNLVVREKHRFMSPRILKRCAATATLAAIRFSCWNDLREG